MPSSQRQKACVACASSKRRCDKQLPECQRCSDRDVDCVYPQPRRRRGDAKAHDAQGGEDSAPQDGIGADVLNSNLNLGDWGVVGSHEVPNSWSGDFVLPYVPTPSAPFTQHTTRGVPLENGNVSSQSCPWFLLSETWDMQRSNNDQDCATFVEFEPFIHAVGQMLHCWVRNGYNSFIHRRLYAKGMPTFLQDAFTTLAAYMSRTPAVKETILQIAEERSSTLTSLDFPITSGAQGILSRLARVQALFVYEFIRLFDGSVRLRASAEQQLPTLRQWVTQMWEAVRQYKGENSSHSQRPLQWTESEFDREYDAASEMWQLWILTESVRRTHLIIDTVANLYQIMVKGWAECAGAVMFTARRGLWEAESAVKWFEMCCEKSPLLVPSLQPEPLLSWYAADEVDDFARLYWRFIVGEDRIQCWVDRSNKASST